MDSQVKERLVGAAVLVALGVWLIPLVLDGPEEPTPVEAEPGLELPIVNEDVPVRTRTVELDRGGIAASSEPAFPEQTRDATEQQAVAIVEPPATSTAASGRDAEDTPGRTAPPASSVSGNTAEEPAPRESQAASGETGAAESASAAPRADSAASSRAESSSGGDWKVQLGSFSERANADRLAERVGTYGYSAKVVTHVAGGRTLHRVRIAGYASRNEAEAAIASLSAHGFVAQVVAPE